MQDIVISSVPYIEPTAPTAAPALLKGYLITQGFEVTAYDWNLEFKRYINDPDLYGELIAYWTGTNRSAMRESTRQQYHTALEHFAKKFASKHQMVGIWSIFTSQPAMPARLVETSKKTRLGRDQNCCGRTWP
jgi:hypothetical protein